jgi:hypothetical protein
VAGEFGVGNFYKTLAVAKSLCQSLKQMLYIKNKYFIANKSK